ncbi:glycosyltransferase family 39 protein [Lysinibacillus sp. CNPSo 3705]|uniref:glycosyltransferase family 39 protein n=1 Tax=Lysinibacillus sp. CNPSo 3705 TaxID=3028148 RepID=UPI00236403C3|nr:glycosyltransferase family 39 protein [Lysinibacillus sp. CNPSo 3705]MDD1504956.1 glycosyltransferase family 39 protein [Lysinibacillus sp. CNPSo 3705]
MKSKQILQFPRILLFILCALLFQIIVFDNILIDVYSWHLKQPETIEGGILLLILLFCYVLVNRYFKTKYSFVIVALITMLYLINSNLFVPTVLTILYFEVFFSIGSCINRKFYKHINNNNISFYLKSFLVGFVVWAAINLFLSLIGYGSISNIRLVTLILFIISIHKGINKPFSFFLIEKLDRFTKNEKDLISCLVVLILALLSKSNRAIDYDSIWYGLRPEYVLVGENSFFDNLGLVQFVHFYPKLFEYFTLPLSDLGDYSFIYCINIIFFILSLIIIFGILNEILNNSFYSIIGTIILGTIPAFANISTTAKPDIFSIFFILLGIYYLLNFINQNKSEELIFGISSLVLSLGGKSTSFLYVPFIGLGFLISMIIYIKKYKKQYFLFSNLYKIKSLYWILVTSLFIFFIICYRTFKLTGYPIYPSGLGLWNKLGFEAKYPVTSEHNVTGLDVTFSLSGIIDRWYKLLFDPKDYEHIIMLWTGNTTFFLILIILLFILTKNFKINFISKLQVFFFAPVILVGIFFATFMINGGDGNYFLIPIILTFIALYTVLRGSVKNSTLQKWINIGIIIFLPTQLLITFISHSSWQWGTQEFTTNLNIYQQESNDLLFETNGLNEIEQYIRKIPNKTRSIGFGDEQVLNHLSTRFENIPGIVSNHLGNESIISSELDFYKYLEWAKIDFLILPREEIKGFENVKKVISQLENDEAIVKIEAQNYYLLDLRQMNLENNIWGRSVLNNGWYSDEGNYRWIAKSASASIRSGDIGELIIEGIVPDNYDEVTLLLVVDGEIMRSDILKSGEFQIKQKLNKNETMEIEIKTDKSFVPKKNGNSNDVRELSIIINNLEVR